MSLTSSMHQFKHEVATGSKNRKHSVASMIGSYKSNRMKQRNTDINTRLQDMKALSDNINTFLTVNHNNRMNNKNKDISTRLQDMKALRDNIHSFLADSCSNRSSMGANTKQFRNDFMNNLRNSTKASLGAHKDFMNNLRNSTKASLGAHKADRMALAADVAGAKAEWLGTAKKKIKPISKEIDTSIAFVPSIKTISAELSDEALTELVEAIPTDLPVEVPTELSGEIPNNGDCPDDLLSGDIHDAASVEYCPVQSPTDEILLAEQTIINETSTMASIEAINEPSTDMGTETITEPSTEAGIDNSEMEQKVLALISDAANGMKMSELSETVHLIDDGFDVQALVIDMIGKGMVRKYRNKYYVA